MMLPETDKPLLRIIPNPANPAYKLLLIVGKNDTALRMAARAVNPRQLCTANRDAGCRTADHPGLAKHMMPALDPHRSSGQAQRAAA